jgi:hypothetical protein
VEVAYGPRAPAQATVVLLLAALVAVAMGGFFARRRDLAAAALLALGLLAALGVSTASTPTSHGLFAVVSYTLWWASPAGMFGWLVLGFAAATWAGAGGRLKALKARFAPPERVRSRTAVATAAGVLAVAAVGGVVAGAGEPDRLERLFAPARKIVDGVTAATPAGGAVLVQGSAGEIATDLQGGVAYVLRRQGVPFVVSTLPGIGTRYDPGRNGHDRVMEVIERPQPAGTRGRVIARAVVSDVPANGSPLQRAARALVVTLAP